MNDFNRKKNLIKFLNIINPSEINIKKEEIFYREKYKEIINYLKLILTESKDLEIYNYVNPKGLVLIHAHPGIDLLDYLKLICSNFYIHCVQFKESEIAENPKEFLEDFTSIFNYFDEILIEESGKQSKDKNQKEDNSKEINNQKLLIVNQNQRLEQLVGVNNLLQKFLFYYQEEDNLTKIIKNNLVIIWVIYNYEGILNVSDQIYKVFDFIIRVPILNKMERQQVFREFMEKNPKISFDINKLVELTEEWEVEEINHLLRTGILKHHINADLNTTSNEITDIIIDLVESREFIPYGKKHLEKNKKEQKSIPEGSSTEKNITERDLKEHIPIESKEEILNQIKSENYSEFMLNQLYENAASENYNELVLIIDKLDKKEPLEDNDRKLLSKYPFILNNSPSRAQIFLEKAKKRIDMITKSFGK
ncbi:MAG: hypothetical protein BAJALOKI3v1_70039 [Promethearchaeota archaeon]|nr:MAG: hypothetical protein BAJALOKI3v1_70039 [Candidatus Lokiarchaeota archaeon]